MEFREGSDKTPIEKLASAVNEFSRELEGADTVVGHFFVGISYMKGDPDVPGGIVTSRRYASSDTDPYGVMGVGDACLMDLREDLSDAIRRCACEENEDDD